MSTGNASSSNLVLALPKGRILKQVLPLLARCDIVPEPAFHDPDDRNLHFRTNHDHLSIIRVRAFDVATFVAFGAAHIGIVGSDVIEEFRYPELYAPLDLKIGGCRLSVAMPEAEAAQENPKRWSHIRVATKYPTLTRRHFAARGVQAECIKLNGAMEIAPSLGLCRRIVDLVESGRTLKANHLVEVETIMDVTSRLIVHKAALKTRPEEIGGWIKTFEENVRDGSS